MPIDILSCYTTPPQPRDYVLPSLLPGTIGSIVSPGGQGKSILALMLAHLVGGGVDLLGFGAVRTGRVVYLSAEDSEDIMHERLFHLGGKLNRMQREACAEGIQAEDLTKYTPDLLNGERAGEWRNVIEQLATDARLLILDTLRSFHSGDENNSTSMSVLIGHLRAIAARTNCAIIFLHHTSKSLSVSGQGDLQQASRGSSVLTDNIRWQAYLAGMTSEEATKYSALTAQPIGGENKNYYVRFGISKQNYGSPFTEKWLRRGNGGILEPIQLTSTVKNTSRENSIKEAPNGQKHN